VPFPPYGNNIYIESEGSPNFVFTTDCSKQIKTAQRLNGAMAQRLFLKLLTLTFNSKNPPLSPPRRGIKKTACCLQPTA
jgi:hypothetical protein